MARQLVILDGTEIKRAISTLSHPFVERLIGPIRREFLDRTISWTALGSLVNLTATTASAAIAPTSGGPNFDLSVIDFTPTDASNTLTAVDFSDFPFGGNSYQFVMAFDGETGPVSSSRSRPPGR